jgi:PhoH-like ATPase
MSKVYVLDTNVILHDAEALFKFDEHSIVLPFTVIEEIDTFKKEQNELGRNARAFSRYMDELRLKGSLVNGVVTNDIGGKLFVVLYDQTVGNCLPYQDMQIMDNRILATAKFVSTYSVITGNDRKEVVMVSKDVNLRIKADVFGIIAEDYKNGKVETDEQYAGVRHITVPQLVIDKVYTQDKLELGDFVCDTPLPNECFIIHSEANTKQSALLRYNSIMKEYRLLPQDMKTVDILPKNAEQQFALDLLKDSEVNLVSMTGKAGSGKTLMALCAGLYGVLEVQRYSKVLLLKPIVAMDNGHELGFLPGTMEEKLSPWMASYADNIELIMAGYVKDTSGTATKKPKGISKADWEVLQEKQAGRTNPIQELIASGLLELGSLEHIRGRSLPNQYIIIDEAQNLTLHALKTIITRVGEGTKIVLMGDVSQIDSPYLDSRSNGLSLCIEKMKECDIAGHITFRKSERSRLAEIAADLL